MLLPLLHAFACCCERCYVCVFLRLRFGAIASFCVCLQCPCILFVCGRVCVYVCACVCWRVCVSVQIIMLMGLVVGLCACLFGSLRVWIVVCACVRARVIE